MTELARHLATLNLFREPDGSLHITCAEAKGAATEKDGKPGSLSEYVDGLIRLAVENLP